MSFRSRTTAFGRGVELLGMIAAGIGRVEFLVAARQRSRARFAHGCSPYLYYFPELIVPHPPSAKGEGGGLT